MKRFNAAAGEYYIMQDEAELKALAAAERALRGQTGSMSIDFVSIEAVQWPDASMGWPEPGRSYAQVLTEGYRVRARAAGKLFECRIAGAHVRCRVVKG